MTPKTKATTNPSLAGRRVTLSEAHQLLHGQQKAAEPTVRSKTYRRGSRASVTLR